MRLGASRVVDINLQPIDRRRAILALVLVNAMWGLSFPMMKCLNLQIDQHFGVTEQTASSWLRSGAAAWMIGIRFSLSLLLFVLFFRNTLRLVRLPHFLAGCGIGALFFCGLMLQVIALATIPASRSGFLTSLAVVFTPLISSMLHRRKPRLTVIAGAAMALTGVAVLAGMILVDSSGVSIANDTFEHWTLGDSLTVISAFFFSAQILLLDELGKRHESIAFTPSMFATTATLAIVAFTFLQFTIPESASGGWSALAVKPAFYLMIALLCAFPSVIAFAWMNKYQPRISAGQAAVIYTLEPVCASLWAMSLPATLSVCCAICYENETFSLPLVVGGMLVLAANVLALWPAGDRGSIDGRR